MIIYFEKVAPSPNQGLLTAKHAAMASQVGPVLGHCVMFMWWNKMLRNDPSICYHDPSDPSGLVHF